MKESTGIDHVTLCVENLAAAEYLFTKILGFDIIWSARRPLFISGAPYDNQPANCGNGQMLALMATSREMVDRAYAAAREHGGVCEGAPGLRPQYHAHYYGAYFRDPEGNKLCVVCHDAPAA